MTQANRRDGAATRARGFVKRLRGREPAQRRDGLQASTRLTKLEEVRTDEILRLKVVGESH